MNWNDINDAEGSVACLESSSALSSANAVADIATTMAPTTAAWIVLLPTESSMSAVLPDMSQVRRTAASMHYGGWECSALQPRAPLNLLRDARVRTLHEVKLVPVDPGVHSLTLQDSGE